MEQPLPWRTQLLEMRLRKAIGKRLGRLAKSTGVGKPGGDGPATPRKVDTSKWPLVNKLMWEGRPIPLRLTDPGAQGGIPASTLRAADHLLSRMAVDRERKAETKFAFIPRRGMIVRFKSPVDGATEYAMVSDWGAQGLTAWTKDHGEVKVAWKDARAATERELAATRKADDDAQEMAGAVTSKFGYEDLVVGLTVTAVEGDHAGSGTEHTGVVVSTHPGAGKGGHLVIEEPSGRLHAARYYDVVQVHEEPPAVSKSMTITIDDGDEADER